MMMKTPSFVATFNDSQNNLKQFTFFSDENIYKSTIVKIYVINYYIELLIEFQNDKHVIFGWDLYLNLGLFHKYKAFMIDQNKWMDL